MVVQARREKYGGCNLLSPLESMVAESDLGFALLLPGFGWLSVALR